MVRSCDLAVARSCRGWPRVVAAAASVSADTEPALEKPPHEGSKRSQHGCAKPDSFVNTE